VESAAMSNDLFLGMLIGLSIGLVVLLVVLTDKK
jgi:hypothetical protein